MSEKALMVGIFGARGTGKNVFAVQLLKTLKPPRLMIWDHKHDPGMSNFGQTFTDLGALIRAMKAPAFHVRYMPDHSRDVQKQFDLFCRAAFAAGNLTLMIEGQPGAGGLAPMRQRGAPVPWARWQGTHAHHHGPGPAPQRVRQVLHEQPGRAAQRPHCLSE
jgi:hypothetical protein